MCGLAMRTVETEKFVVSASLSLFLRVSELASANTQVFKLQTAKDTFPKKERCWAMSAPWPVFPFLFFFPLAFLDKLSAAKEPESHFELFIVSKTCFFLLVRHGEEEQQGCYTGVPQPFHSWAEADQGAVDQGTHYMYWFYAWK